MGPSQEEMISHHHNVSVKDNTGMMMRDCNNSTYSEFDNDGNSYNKQASTTTW